MAALCREALRIVLLCQQYGSDPICLPSKWNKIAHRMFSFISLNWQGRPLVSYETVIQLISSIRTRTGLRVKAVLDPKEYATEVEIPDQEMAALNVRTHRCHPQWNYSIRPRSEDRSHKPTW